MCTHIQSVHCYLSSCYLYEHPEELTEVKVVREQTKSRTAVLGKHCAMVSGHQKADLQTNKEVCSHRCVQWAKQRKIRNERMQTVG